MLAANYIKHFKVLGKLARLYDDVLADVGPTTEKLIASRLMDQVATGESASYDATLLVAAHMTSMDNAINEQIASAAALTALAQTIASEYLRNALFTDDLTTTPANATVAAVLDALQTDMGAGVDNVTFGTVTTNGFVRFFDLFAPSGSWNTESDSTADYKDSVYVVQTVV